MVWLKNHMEHIWCYKITIILYGVVLEPWYWQYPWQSSIYYNKNSTTCSNSSNESPTLHPLFSALNGLHVCIWTTLCCPVRKSPIIGGIDLMPMMLEAMVWVVSESRGSTRCWKERRNCAVLAHLELWQRRLLVVHSKATSGTGMTCTKSIGRMATASEGGENVLLQSQSKLCWTLAV